MKNILFYNIYLNTSSIIVTNKHKQEHIFFEFVIDKWSDLIKCYWIVLNIRADRHLYGHLIICPRACVMVFPCGISKMNYILRAGVFLLLKLFSQKRLYEKQ